jgi:2-methylcitrate dehydratase
LESPQLKEMINFGFRAKFDDIDTKTVEQLKRHLLDSIASLIFSMSQETPKKLRRQVSDIQSKKDLIPMEALTIDRAAELYTALIRYLDFMDNFLAKEATCHPSDNIGSVLAACVFKELDGKDFLKAMAVSYQLVCRLTEKFPVMSKGFDHTVLLNFSIMIAIAELLGLTKDETRHACGMVGCTINPFVTLRAAYTSEWKGFASSCTAFNCLNKAFLAKRGMTGPYSIFEGPMAMNQIMDMELVHNWSHEEEFELIPRCILKEYNSEVHSQSLIEALLELDQQQHFSADSVKEIEATTFLTAYHIIGGGEYGDRKLVVNKEQADHSLPYLLAVALLDKDIYPKQLTIDRINRSDVQELLQKVTVSTSLPLKEPRKLVTHLDPYTLAYPDKMMAKISIKLEDGKHHSIEKEDYHGFFTRPLQWSDVEKKFHRLMDGIISHSSQQQIVSIIGEFEGHKVSELMDIIHKEEMLVGKTVH